MNTQFVDCRAVEPDARRAATAFNRLAVSVLPVLFLIFYFAEKTWDGDRTGFISSFGDQILDFFLKRGPNRRFLSETGTKGWFIFQFGGQRAISRRFGDQNPIPPKDKLQTAN